MQETLDDAHENRAAGGRVCVRRRGDNGNKNSLAPSFVPVVPPKPLSSGSAALLKAIAQNRVEHDYTPEFRDQIKAALASAVKSFDQDANKSDMPKRDRAWQKELMRDDIAKANGITRKDLQEILESE